MISTTSASTAWAPARDSMLTRWGAQLTPETAWREYPRPAFARKEWTNLNGLWQYRVTDQGVTAIPGDWEGRILVPFAIESALSGVKRRITPQDAIWYRRGIAFTPDPARPRVHLHFEAVDYRCTVWLNGIEVGSHIGGNLPFTLDVSAAVRAGENTLTVRVADATDTAWQLHGKQVINPRGIWYTPVSGIWQTVWLEQLPDVHLAGVKITPATSGTVLLDVDSNAAEVTVIASLDGEAVARVSGPPGALTLRIPDPKLWSPESPILYDLTLTAGADTVISYVGLRETTVVRDRNGHLRLHLNGNERFHWGTLDQGWWPDGLLTPPSDAAMRFDVDFLKAAGFNTIRKHIKVEPRRYYTYCDRVGMLVWQDQVSSGTGVKNHPGPADRSSPPWTRLCPKPEDGDWPDAAHAQYMAELEAMIDALYNHPSIVQWVLFNEAWGQHRTMKVGRWITARDPSRQINIASGGNFWPVGHIVDYHEYPHPEFPFHLGEGGRFDDFVKIVGEFGGHGFPLAGHLWSDDARNWGYGGLPKDREEWVGRYRISLRHLRDLRGKGIAAGIYTQTTDVEGEINGLITYDRKVQKLPPDALRRFAAENGLCAGP